MGIGYCKECGATDVEVLPVPAGCLVCMSCLSTYSKRWIEQHYPDELDNTQGNAATAIAVTKMGGEPVKISPDRSFGSMIIIAGLLSTQKTLGPNLLWVWQRQSP